MNTAGEDAGTPGGELSTSQEVAHDLSLMLMYLSSWAERPGAPRFWKGFDFEILNQLADEGLISDSRRAAKSAYLTEEGVRRARELLVHYGLATRESG
ncbi:MAG: DUF6429 family protein [Chloroflexota bacterium]|nr:DUF6429 family protein [Chloroflexota bacterium]